MSGQSHWGEVVMGSEPGPRAAVPLGCSVLDRTFGLESCNIYRQFVGDLRGESRALPVATLDLLCSPRGGAGKGTLWASLTVTALSGNMFKPSPSNRGGLSWLQEDNANWGRTLSPYRAHREQQCWIQPLGCSNGCEGELLCSAIKQCFISYCANCKEIVRAAEGCGPPRPPCEVMD